MHHFGDDEAGRRWRRAIVLLPLLLGAAAANAQSLPRELPGSVQPGRDRPASPVLPEGDFDFTILAPRRAPVPREVDELQFDVREIRIVGATLFSPEALRPLYDSLIGRRARLGDVIGVADRIEAKYRESGYIISRAFVPPQRVSDGVFTINVVEGYIKAVVVDGAGENVRQAIENFLAPVLRDRPLNVATLERGMLLVNDLPGIAATGLLRPNAEEPGASDLVVSVRQTPLTGALSVSNRYSEFAGPWFLTAEAAANSLLRGGDQIYLSVAATPEFSERRSLSARYATPVGASGLTASLNGFLSNGTPGASLSQFDIFIESYAFGPRLAYPLVRSRANTLVLDGGLTVQDARIKALGQPLSHDQWRVADASLSWQQNGYLGGSTVTTLGIAQGLDIFGATPAGSSNISRQGAGPDFTKLTAAARRVQALIGDFSLAVSAAGQYAFTSLLIGEEIAFGGLQIGRGYDPAAIVGDHGLGGSAELRYDLRLDTAYIEAAQFYAFYDTAKIWNVADTNTARPALASTGVGVRVALPASISANLEFARTLIGVPGSGDGRPESRVLFGASVRF
jgi:hemolysin activation/secretion protein